MLEKRDIILENEVPIVSADVLVLSETVASIAANSFKATPFWAAREADFCIAVAISWALVPAFLPISSNTSDICLKFSSTPLPKALNPAVNNSAEVSKSIAAALANCVATVTLFIAVSVSKPCLTKVIIADEISSVDTLNSLASSLYVLKSSLTELIERDVTIAISVIASFISKVDDIRSLNPLVIVAEASYISLPVK